MVLLLRQMLDDNLHEGIEYVRIRVQHLFWLICSQNPLPSIKISCVRCWKPVLQPFHPHIVDLPREWLAGSVYLFKNTGVEYFVPCEVSVIGKALVLFVYVVEQQSSAHRSCRRTANWCVHDGADFVHGQTWETTHSNQWLLNKLCGSGSRVQRVLHRVQSRRCE